MLYKEVGQAAREGGSLGWRWEAMEELALTSGPVQFGKRLRGKRLV